MFLPDEETEKVFFLPLERESSAAAYIIIGTDPLMVDNRYPFWLHPAPTIRVLAVNGDPQPTPYKDELFYLDRAIEPALSQGARMKLTVVDVDMLARKKLKNFDVIILANIPRLVPRDARALEGYVRGGGGLFVTVGDRVVPSLMNQLLGGILPRTMRSSRLAGDAAASTEGRDRRLGFLTASTEEHPILANFSRDDLFGLKQVQVKKYML